MAISPLSVCFTNSAESLLFVCRRALILESTNTQFKIVHHITWQSMGLVHCIIEGLEFGDFLPDCIFFPLSSLKHSWEHR